MAAQDASSVEQMPTASLVSSVALLHLFLAVMQPITDPLPDGWSMEAGESLLFVRANRGKSLVYVNKRASAL